MGIWNQFSQSRLINKLETIERKRIANRNERDRLKRAAETLKHEYEACLAEIREIVQKSPSGTVIAPSSLPSSESFGKPGSSNGGN